MSRLPNLNARKIIRALKRAGFEDNGQGGDVRRDLMKEIIRQAGLSEEEFRKFL